MENAAMSLAYMLGIGILGLCAITVFVVVGVGCYRLLVLAASRLKGAQIFRD